MRSFFSNTFEYCIQDNQFYFIGLTEESGRQVWRTELKYCAISNVLEQSKEDLGYSISLFPNPVTDWLKVNLGVNFSENESWSIVNNLGQQVMTGQFSSMEQQIDVRQFIAGNYYTIVTSEDRTFIKTFVKVEN